MGEEDELIEEVSGEVKGVDTLEVGELAESSPEEREDTLLVEALFG